MSNPGALGAVEYEAESSFGEDVTTFGTLRIPILDPVDVSGLKQDKIDSSRTQQFMQGGSLWINGAMGGSFKTKFYLTGHGSSTSGATTATAMETLLGLILGNATLSAAAGTTFTGGTATAPTTTASATFAAGSLCFGGTLGDGRCGGQALAISSHVTTTLNLLTAAGAGPNNGDVLYSANNIYLPETPTSSLPTSIRMRALTANLRYEMHGCVPTAISLAGFGPNELLTAEVTWAPAWWRYTTATYPSVLATDSSNGAVNAAGSLFVNDVGTATRSTRVYRNFKVDIKLGMEVQMGPGGVNAAQAIVSARRTPSAITVSWTEDADAATLTPALPGFGTGTTMKHVLWTSSTAPGSRVAMYMPQVASKVIATQKIDGNVNRLTWEGMAYTGPTTTTDLTASAWRMAFA